MDKVQLTACFSYFFAYMLQIIAEIHAYKIRKKRYNFQDIIFNMSASFFVQTAFYP